MISSGRLRFLATLLLIAPTIPSGGSTLDDPKLREGYEAILAEYDSAMKRYMAEAAKAKDEADYEARAKPLYPDSRAYANRFVDLAAANPGDPASRDALLWVLGTMRTDRRENPALARAIDLLIGSHADDLQAARATLSLSDRQSPQLDRLCAAMDAGARSREVKGTACLALGRHLLMKSEVVAFLAGEASPFRLPFEEADPSGKPTTKLGKPVFEAAYEAHLRSLDPVALANEAERSFERVMAEYANVPNAPKARRPTLGEEARASLDELRNLAVGRPAPEIEGPGLDGAPLKLSDYRGKVVLLVFWGSWCGPCLDQAPHERELAARHKDRPFAILGVDCEEDKEKGIEAASREGMTWPHFFDAGIGEGPICARYHVQGFPTVFVIDAKGVIRSKHLVGSLLDKVVEGLLQEAEAANQ
ncbi:TlpA family protein disulfide reductase [Paludisphaera soli]|uniref:TlpA family protein disulfide reductase n=1 Tax=Paludisphaera soli TaxID=2712865 RepID=UPI0013ED76AA|nr:TlpA disulfide reductase family protein [Paludisphaera soli]